MMLGKILVWLMWSMAINKKDTSMVDWGRKIC
jgi:hypothetical protein